MKKTRLLSLLMALVIMIGIMVPMTAPSASAATNCATSYKNGDLVKAGSYYFATAHDYDKGYTYVYRISENLKSKKVIAKGTTVSSLFTYKGVVYYSVDQKICAHNTKTLKTTTLRNTDKQIRGICASGLLISDYSYSVMYLLRFNGTVKKIAGKHAGYIAANDKYIFYTVSENKYTDSNYQYCETVRVKRYTISSGATKNMGKFTAPSSYSYNGWAFDAHVFKSNIVFTYGLLEGTGSFYRGAAYTMKSDGSSVKKLRNNVGPDLTPGKDCVYVRDSSSSGETYTIFKISSAGKISSQAKNTRIVYTTVNNYSVSHVKVGSNYSYSLYVNSAVNGKAGTKLLNAPSFLTASDPYDAYVNTSADGAYGDVILATTTVYSYQGVSTWRPRTLRSNAYLINTKTKKKIRLDK